MKILRENEKTWKLHAKIDNGEIVEILRYAESWKKGSPYTLIDNFIFEADIGYREFIRGQSAAYFKFKDVNGPIFYYMSMSSMDKFLRSIVTKKINVANNYFNGIFTYVKQGENYYVVPFD
jgi:hypothetical protein